MIARSPVRVHWFGVLIIMGLCAAAPSLASGQNVGAGPLTSTLTDTEPTSGVFDWGRVKLAPGIVVEELGWDNNIFDERDNPKEDWVFRGTPDVSVFSALRWLTLSAYAGSELSYFHTYEAERSVGYEYRGRVDFMISRLHPFFGGGETRSRTRPNGEIDTRADRDEGELSGGLAFDLGPHQKLYAAASRYRNKYFNSVEDGVELSEALNHDRYDYSVGVKTDLTPLTALTISGRYLEDRFESLPIRDSETRAVTAVVRVGAEAAFAGTVSVSYEDFKPVDPALAPFRGVTAEAALTYPFLEIGRLSGSFLHGVEYSFDYTEGYYVETTGLLAYTHRLFGEVDAQIRGSKSWFDYGYREGSPARQDTLAQAAVSLGYNLRNRTRVALNYERAERRSPAFEERNYDRTRVFLSWVYAF